MMSAAVLRAWKTVKNHIPLIKFRKGGPFRENTPSAVSNSPAAPKAPKAPGPVLTAATQHVPIIEDWQLPRHYRRAPLDDKEIDAINSGGAY